MVAQLTPGIPLDQARRGYSTGTAVLQAILPAHTGPTATAPVTMNDEGTQHQNGIEAKEAVLRQLDAALRLIDRSDADRILTLGGAVMTLEVPDRDGRPVDVVLGFDDARGYLENRPFLGVLIGRYGNRIARAAVPIDDRMYQLTANEGPNQLHGGPGPAPRAPRGGVRVHLPGPGRLPGLRHPPVRRRGPRRRVPSSRTHLLTLISTG